jgi:hypothetical protein
MEGKTLAEKLAESAKGGCGRTCRQHSCDHCRVHGIRARNACRAAPAATKASLIVGGSRVIRKVIGKIAIRLAAIPRLKRRTERKRWHAAIGRCLTSC